MIYTVSCDENWFVYVRYILFTQTNVRGVSNVLMNVKDLRGSVSLQNNNAGSGNQLKPDFVTLWWDKLG